MSEGGESRRYDSLDGVRAAAMLLGVVYHAVLFGGMSGGARRPGQDRVATVFLEWLHSFRMPLFFIISGFFCAMMLEKHGLREYLKRRWVRIGLPLLLGVFAIVPMYHALRGMGDVAGTGGGGALVGVALVEVPMAGGDRAASLSERYLGGYGRLMRLDYLWFLWYLLVFATVVPVAGAVSRRVMRRGGLEVKQARGRRVPRSGVLALVLGVIAGPLLLIASGGGGWSLGHAAGIFERVPEFVIHLERDMPFYLAFFVMGWMVYRQRSGLSGVGGDWLRNLIIGTVAHGLAAWLSNRFAMQREMAWYGFLRLMGLLVYALGSAYTAFGFLGFFQRYVNRPSRAGRYLAETAFWVYMVHQPIMMPILRWFAQWDLPWWLEGPCVSVMTAVSALVLYELVVRPTVLVGVFGPGARKRGPDRATAEAVVTRG